MENTAARTALGPMIIAAVDQYEHPPLVRDDLARRILPGAAKAVAGLARWRPVRRQLIKVTEKQIPGLWAAMLCRKRYIDDALAASAGTGIEAVVILGAGFDTRAYRLPALAGLPVFEVDLPANIARKRAAVTRMLASFPESVTQVPIDFETQDLGEELAKRGYRGTGKTFFVWEAVTQYLTEPGVRKTFDFLRTAPAGSQLMFTFVRKDFLEGAELYGAEAAYRGFVLKQGLWRFGFAPEEVAGFLAEYGWREAEQMGPAEFSARYVEPSGRVMPVSELERSVRAEKV
jgi:methyltransferase (TIGR00027 family)